MQRLALLTLLGLSVSQHAVAESPGDMLSKAQAIVHTLHLNGLLLLLSVLATGLIGIIIAAIQRWEGQKIKMVVVILGVVTASLTYAANTMFSFTHKQYFARESKANLLILQMEKYQRHYDDAKPDQKDAIWDELTKVYEEIENLKHENIEDKLPQKITELRPPIIDWMIKNASAQSVTIADTDLPSWVMTPPTSDNFYYFVGVADGYDLGVTKEKAQLNALAHTQSYLNFQLNEINDKPKGSKAPIANQLLRLTKEKEEYLSFDKDTQTVRVYQLIGISKKSLERNAEHYANSAGYKNPGLVASQLVENNKVWEKYYSAWALTMNTELDQYKNSMPPIIYSEKVRERDRFLQSEVPSFRVSPGSGKW